MRATTLAAAAFIACVVALDLAAAGAERPPLRPNAAAATEIDGQTSPLDLDLRGMNGARYAFRCPPGNHAANHVVGSGPYTDNSSICAAAVHAGAIDAEAGGDVTIEIRPGETHYAASERNHIRSAAFDRAWSGSFVVLRDGTSARP